MNRQMTFTTNDPRIANSHFFANTQSNQINIERERERQRQIQQQRTVAVTTTGNVPPPPKKMKWGEPIWFFFHTLAHKVKEDEFPRIKDELLNIIYNICNNLPCPMCAAHATEYMNKINFKTIATKKDLKDLLFVFHNTVNERKGFPMFLYEDLDKKYNTAITRNIIINFFNTFQVKNNSIHMMANDMYRSRLTVQLKDWFNKNYMCFDP